jgi:hypothetical protein
MPYTTTLRSETGGQLQDGHPGRRRLLYIAGQVARDAEMSSGRGISVRRRARCSRICATCCRPRAVTCQTS